MNCIKCKKILVGRQKKFCSNSCKNNQLQSYEAQQKRGHLRKIYLCSLLGGCCSVCGYDKNYAALEFHHIDPTQKEFALDLRKLSNSTMDKCLTEAKKCKLLCSNCHAEHHYPNSSVGTVGIEPTSFPL